MYFVDFGVGILVTDSTENDHWLLLDQWSVSQKLFCTTTTCFLIPRLSVLYTVAANGTLDQFH